MSNNRILAIIPGERGTKGPIQDAIVTTGSMAFLVPVPQKEAFQCF